MCTGSGGRGDLVASAVLAATAVLVVVIGVGAPGLTTVAHLIGACSNAQALKPMILPVYPE